MVRLVGPVLCRDIPLQNFVNPEHIGFLVGMAGCYLVRTARVPAPHALLAVGLAGF